MFKNSIIFNESRHNFKTLIKLAKQNVIGCTIIFFLKYLVKIILKITVNTHIKKIMSFVKYFGNNNLRLFCYGTKIVSFFWYISTILVYFSLLCGLVWKDQRTSKLPLRKRTVLLLSCQKICYLFLVHGMSTGPRSVVSLRGHSTTT